MIWWPAEAILPDDSYGCLLTVNRESASDDRFNEVYPKFAAWDGTNWVDIDGNVVTDTVLFWALAPKPCKRSL